MQAHTKRHPIEARFSGSPAVINQLRQLARQLGAEELRDTVPAAEVFPELADERRQGAILRGLRHREGLTQAQLAERLMVRPHHVSEWENGKRPIGKSAAHKLADVLGADYRLFL